MARPRGKSSLGADPRGDTGAPSFATFQPKSMVSSAPTSPQVSPSLSIKSTINKPHTKRRKARSFFRRWKDLSFRHTWVNPLILVLIILFGYAVNPTPSNPLHSAIFLSYDLPKSDPDAPTIYGKGPRDFAFVAFYIAVLSFTREFLMQRLIRPWAIYCGMRGRGKVSRFMEQVYTAIYFAVFGPLGLYVMSKTPVWYFNTDGMFEGFPHRTHEGIFKAYYLLQASYWSQQAIVLMLQLEKPRKDFKELVGHHVITLALIGLSYRFHFTYMGLAVYITHDISDFFLATSKTLNYLDSVIIGPYFAFFILIWIYLRHYLNLSILWAVLTSFRTIGPFELNWETQQYKCWISQYITFALLASLQSVNLFWLWFILRIARNYVGQGNRKDERSDNEDEEEEDSEEVREKKEITAREVEHDTKRRIEAHEIMVEKPNGAVDVNGPELLLNGHSVDTKANGVENKPLKRGTKKKR